ncbi:MAG: hypothetical protein AAGM67_00520 [Bacteroidota bacterium]
MPCWLQLEAFGEAGSRNNSEIGITKQKRKMADSKWTKAFIGFGVLTILSGIALIVQSQYVIGIPGTIVGAWLIMQNVKNLNASKEE